RIFSPKSAQTSQEMLVPASDTENAAGYLVTISTDLYGNQDCARIVLADSLEALSAGDYEDIYNRHFAGGGTPYALSFADRHWYLTEHRLPDHAIWRFDVGYGKEEAPDGEDTDGADTPAPSAHAEIRDAVPVY
ncbi:MAG: hypothetical protein J5967_00750, partial [Oscillospiraceae bacterium]|nr:hypothetical protein [Oscillospiraceae bacterium]